jgi:predicted kinase
MSQSDPIEQDFLEALQRLVEGKPLNKTLKGSAKAGKLKINAVSVALEAGRSRTLIALENCRYPKVREAIKLAQGGKKSLPTTYTQLIDNLRADLATVKAERRLLETKMADHVLARRKAEVNSRRDAAEASRLRKLVVEFEKVVHLPQKETVLPRLVLIRGLHGSGKSTKANGYREDGYQHFESDQFFQSTDGYAFDETRLPQAHAWCLEQTRKALAEGEYVVVANVFATEQDVQPYIDLGFDYQIIDATHKGQSIHQVPADVVKRTKAIWVPSEELLKKITTKPEKVVKAKVTSIHSAQKDKE